MRLQIENGNNVRVRTSNATTTYEASASFTNDGNWHHLAFTSSTNVSAPGISKVYYDGVLTTMSRDDLPFIVAYADNTAFTIGSRGGSHPWDGTLGDIRIYDEVLDQKAIDYISTAANYGDGRIPEPATMMLLGIGGLGLVIRGRRRA